MDKIIILFIILLIILFFIYLYVQQSRQVKEMEGFLNPKRKKELILSSMEVDSNSPSYESKNNLIENGNFQYGKQTPNFVNQNGYNKIISLENPDKSTFVLEQRNDQAETVYEIRAPAEINSAYLFYFWIQLDPHSSIESMNIEKYIQIRIPQSDFNNYLPKITYNIIKTVTMGDQTAKKNAWYLFKVQFHTQKNIQEQMYISFILNQANRNVKYVYLTGLSLYRVLNDAQNFIFNKQLICYADASTYESHNTIFRDLSGQGNDLYFSNIPSGSIANGYIELDNTKIMGFSSNKINNEAFTIFMMINQQNEMPKVNSIIDQPFDNDVSMPNNKINAQKNTNIYEKILLSFPGNNKYSFEIGIYEDYLYVLNDKVKVKSSEKLNYYNKASLCIVYENGTLNIFNDGINILSTSIDKIYFNNDRFLINKNKNIDMYLYAFLIYNKVVSSSELREIREYFITNQNKQSSKLPNILDHSFDNVFQQTNNPNPLIKPFEDLNMNGQVYIDGFQNKCNNQSNAIKNVCIDNCNNLCKQYLTGENPSLEKYTKCIENCKYVLPECNTYCADEKNKSSLYCREEEDPNKIICPRVYKKNGNYYVYVPPNSYYSNVFTGTKSFGSNIDKARYIYSQNFPKCLIPDELYRKKGNQGDDPSSKNNNCPYTINELNPCNISQCVDVNWNVDDYHKLKINDKCKKAVSNYCHLHYDYDENCMCWDPKYKNDERCIKLRKFFENPKDYCLPGSYNIEDHPDFKQYIKKDKIPCWGCTIKN